MRWILVLLVAAMATAASAKEPASKGKAKPATKGRAAAQSGAAGTMEAATASFPRFCEEWMNRLAQHERDNIAHIKWEPSSVGVRGTYTGYSREHTCVTKTGTDSVPVGRLTYMEMRYEKEGKNESEASQSAPQTIETIEVTEIFRYGEGKWLY